MPIPADDCTDSEMSVDANPSDSKSDVETEAKVNGDSHKKLNGIADVNDSTETDKAPAVLVKKEIKQEEEEDDEEEENEEAEEEEEKNEGKETQKEPNVQNEPLVKSTDEPVKNGTSEEQKSEVQVENSASDNVSVTNVDDKSKDIEGKDDEVKPMEIDETNDQPKEDTVVIKKEIIEEPDNQVVTGDFEAEETEKLNNREANHNVEVLKNGDGDTNQVNGEVKLSDDDKSIKSEKVSPKVPVEEDLSSEISTETLSPKQVPHLFVKF